MLLQFMLKSVILYLLTNKSNVQLPLVIKWLISQIKFYLEGTTISMSDLHSDLKITPFMTSPLNSVVHLEQNIYNLVVILIGIHHYPE